MRKLLTLLFAVAVSFLVDSSLMAVFAAEQEYRNDDGSNKKLPWFKLVNGQFPPEGSAHYIQGELIKIDHPERTTSKVNS